MKDTSLPKVTFYRVKDNKAKLQFICQKAQEAFKQEKRLLITVPSFEAAQYIDALLWRSPSESFLPHVIADTSTAEWIAITMQEECNVNKATRLLHLFSTPSKFYHHFEHVYDLFDESDPQKLKLSQERLQFYESKGLSVKIES